jgi:hypothetical protein
LSKKQAELFGSRLKRMESSPPRYWNVCLLKTPKWIQRFFSQINDLVFCNDISSVTDTPVQQHDPTEWHLTTLQMLA